jgi:hypothetical protein
MNVDRQSILKNDSRLNTIRNLFGGDQRLVPSDVPSHYWTEKALEPVTEPAGSNPMSTKTNSTLNLYRERGNECKVLCCVAKVNELAGCKTSTIHELYRIGKLAMYDQSAIPSWLCYGC